MGEYLTPPWDIEQPEEPEPENLPEREELGRNMKDFDPYKFLDDNLEPRPFDKDKNRDGNVHYIHQCDVWTLIEKMQSGKKDKEVAATSKAECVSSCSYGWGSTRCNGCDHYRTAD